MAPTMVATTDRVITASQRRVVDSIGEIASMATLITSNSVGRYILTRPSRPRSSSDASSSTTAGVSEETYRATGLPVPSEI